MLAAIITFLLLGGGANDALLSYIKDTSGIIDEVVLDEDRRDAAEDTLDRMKDRAKQLAKAKKAASKSIGSFIKEGSADEAGIEAILDEMEKESRAFNSEMVAMRFELKDQLTREEWEALFSNAE